MHDDCDRPLMPEIHYVTAQVGENQISEGFYMIEDGILTMVDPEGEPVKLNDGSPVQHTMRPEDNEIAIAKMLTKKLRKHFRGETVEGFGDTIHYPQMGVA